MKKDEIQNIFQTGRTTPPKSNQGLIAFLIILVILLCGIISGLSMLNIRMFRMLEQMNAASDEPAVSFYRQDQTVASDGVDAPALGLTGQELTTLYQHYYELPRGLYISHITPGSPAERADLRCGDILQAVGGHSVATEEEFLQILTSLQAGQHITVTVYRDSRTLTVPLTVTE